ncbi:hypothetical protein C4K40_0202 [Pseudomonas sp. CMR5c]|nr:hypothetical protein C4K40_0202 [Pseudomonas sp. CMR5c]
MSRLKDAALRSSDASCASTVDRLQQAEKTPAKTVHAHRGADPYNWFICSPLTRRSMKFAAIQPAACPGSPMSLALLPRPKPCWRQFQS